MTTHKPPSPSETAHTPRSGVSGTADTPWLDEAAAARRLRVSTNTLTKWRHAGLIVPGIHLGRVIRYHRDALDSW